MIIPYKNLRMIPDIELVYQLYIENFRVMDYKYTAVKFSMEIVAESPKDIS